MKPLYSGSISKNLALLVILAVVPALSLVLYSGMERREQAILEAQHDILLLTHTMAETQNDITDSARQILSTLSLLPEFQTLDIKACTAILRDVLERNPQYLNIALSDINGNVLTSGRSFTPTNLRDRKHFREALERKGFAVGEYIISRVGTAFPSFAFAYPVLDKNNVPKAVLTMAIKLAHLSRSYEVHALGKKSFIAVTDHKGIRLFYYPPNEETSPIGKPIKTSNWEMAINAEKPGVFISKGSDGIRRMYAFEQVRLTTDSAPYMYVWAGVPEDKIMGPANSALRRNMLLMLLAGLLALFIAWVVGKNRLISPISNLVVMTRRFAEGKHEARKERTDALPGEIGALTTAFYDMADAVILSQKTLQENEARFRILMDSLEAFVYAADMNTYEVLFINEYGKRLFGDITGRICWQSIQQGQLGPCSFCTNRYLLDSAGNPGDIYTWEFQNTITGKWHDIRDRAIKWIDGRIVRLEIATDISDRKLMETRLSEERERLAVTLRSIGDGVITTDLDGRVVLINKVAETLTGWSASEAIGRPLAEVFTVVDGDTRQASESLVSNVLLSGKIIDMTSPLLLISKTGRERNISDSGAPMKDRDGRIVGVVVVFRDVTDRLHMEQEVIKAKKLESIGVLAGGIAHDFNNILAAILGNIELSRMDPNLALRTQKLLDEAAKASFRARDLTQQLLTFAKGGEPIKETASLPEIVKDSADFVLRGQKVACRYSFPDDLWLVDIDKGQISQVVQNIILNACHAMPNGGFIEVSCENMTPERSLKIILPKGRNYVKLSVADSGIGMPANVLDRIFDPYFSTKQHGSGLGLAITHSIVSKHEGLISVQSSPGVGTKFTVYLPASEQQSHVAAVKETEAERSGKKARIMVMDDEEQVRNVMQSMLQEMGHEVLSAEDGSEAIGLYKGALEARDPFDVIIMDLTIPGGMGGQEAVKKILEINSGADVIVSSGYSNDPVMANYRHYGFCAAIVKPVSLSALQKTIGQVLNAKRQKQDISTSKKSE